MTATSLRACRLATLLLLAAPVAHAQQAHVLLDWAPHRNTQQLVPFMAGVISPEVSDTGMIHAALGTPITPWARRPRAGGWTAARRSSPTT